MSTTTATIRSVKARAVVAPITDLTGKAVALRRTIQTVGWVERSDTHHLYPSA